MTTLTSVSFAQESKLKSFMKSHPLISYFVMAYLFTWVLVIPITLSQMGVGLFEAPEGLLFILLLLSTYSGPLPAALIMTSVLDGKEGRRQLWRRMFQWRVGFRWYLLVLLAYPVVFLAGMSFYAGIAPWVALFENWPLLFTSYLPVALIGILFPGFGEEPGWRGFALPRLQEKYGPLLGTFILALLHGLWHLPVYFIPGAILEGPFDLTQFIANTCLLITLTFFWTWLFNRAGGNIFFAMFVHGVSNATSGLIPQLGIEIPDPWFGFKTWIIFVIVLILFTRGRLGYVSAEGKKLDR
jgi:membrane protease YdiL (CAAX protease family)